MHRTLLNKSKKTQLSNKVVSANSFTERLVGLIGRRSMDINETLWISQCNWIHTLFMRFSIDVIFVDDQLIVCDIKQNIRPWKLSSPVFKAQSVFEFSAGTISSKKVNIGDQLYVGN